jgi:glycosyltransferase involved in cell wall biosynthesis
MWKATGGCAICVTSSAGKPPTRMRILGILPSINPVTGGPSKSAVRQMTQLARLGHHVECFTTMWPEFAPGDGERVSERDGLIVREFPATPIWPANHVPYSHALVAAVRRARGRFDFYHAHSLWNPLITHSISLLRVSRDPYAITCHGMLDPVVFARHRALKWCWANLWERRNVEGASLLHFTSDEECRKAQSGGWRLRRTVVMPNIVAIPKKAVMSLPRMWFDRDYPRLTGKIVIAFVGRLNWVKNLHLLVSALARVRGRGWDAVLLCVGPDSDGLRQALERQATQVGVRQHVVFTGLLEGDTLQRAYARADVVALVSRKENFGLAAAEALAIGVPVVLSDGVDMGKDWVAPPVWRVEQTVESIVEGLVAALSYAREAGVPCAAALRLAEREWGQSQIRRLADAYVDILAARHGQTLKPPLMVG